MNGPSPHLTWKELSCRDAARTPYPESWRETRAVILANEFERVRAALAAPIRIGSAYRTEAHNRLVGGAKQSQHCQGRALDLYPPDGWSVERFFREIRAVAMSDDSLIFGLGRYPSFVHIDTRPKPSHGKIIIWQGSRAWAEEK